MAVVVGTLRDNVFHSRLLVMEDKVAVGDASVPLSNDPPLSRHRPLETA